MGRFFTNNFLITGGIYFIISLVLLPFSEYEAVKFADAFICMLFVVTIVIMLFNKVPIGIILLKDRQPVVASYLAAVGWFPYVSAFGSFVMTASNRSEYFDTLLKNNFSDEDLAYFAQGILPAVLTFLLCLSLVLATVFCIKRRRRKQPKTFKQ